MPTALHRYRFLGWLQLLSSVRGLPTMLKHNHGIRAIVFDCVCCPPWPLPALIFCDPIPLRCPPAPLDSLCLSWRDEKGSAHGLCTVRAWQLSTLQWFDKSDARRHSDTTPTQLLDCALGFVQAVARDYRLLILGSRWSAAPRSLSWANSVASNSGSSSSAGARAQRQNTGDSRADAFGKRCRFFPLLPWPQRPQANAACAEPGRLMMNLRAD